MQYKKSCLFVDISNFSKTKGLRENLSLNKNSSNDKEQKKTSVQLRNEKKSFCRDVGPQSDINWRKYYPIKLPRFFNIQSGFSERFHFFNFHQGKLSYIYLIIIIFHLFFTRICLTFFTFIQVQRKKTKTKKLSKKLGMKEGRTVPRECD